MVNLALAMCGGTDDKQVCPVEVTKLRDVGLYKRSRAFPPLSAVSGVACFVRVLTNDVRKLRWERFPQDTLTEEGRAALQSLRLNADLIIKAADKWGGGAFSDA